MHTRIHLITPVITQGIRDLAEVEPFVRPDLSITQSLIETGPASIECESDEALSVPGVMAEALRAERDGAHALIIDCMGDPGLGACRELVSIPVLGPAQTSMHLAAMLGHRFAFVTVLARLRPMIDGLVARYGLRDSYAAFSAIDIPVLELHRDLERVKQQLAQCAIDAVRKHGAGAIVLGCTGFLGCGATIRERLLDQELDVPVIDPIPATLHAADALVKCGLSHAKHVYPAPGRKALGGYALPDFYDAP